MVGLTNNERRLIYNLLVEKHWGSEKIVKTCVEWRSSFEPQSLLAFGRSMKAENLPIFLKFGNAENHRYLCCLAKGGDDRTIPPLNMPLIETT